MSATLHMFHEGQFEASLPVHNLTSLSTPCIIACVDSQRRPVNGVMNVNCSSCANLLAARWAKSLAIETEGRFRCLRACSIRSSSTGVGMALCMVLTR